MEARGVVLILLFAICIPMSFAQTKDSSSAKSSTELMNRWLLKERGLAAKGNAEAQDMLGCFYETGWGGVLQDYTKAAVWFRKAAEQGDPGSQYGLGELYLEGEGVPQDYQQAYFWLDLAAARRNSIVPLLPDDAPQALKSVSQSVRTKVLSGVVDERDEAASHLTRAELLRVQQRAEKWLQSHTR